MCPVPTPEMQLNTLDVSWMLSLQVRKPPCTPEERLSTRSWDVRIPRNWVARGSLPYAPHCHRWLETLKPSSYPNCAHPHLLQHHELVLGSRASVNLHLVPVRESSLAIGTVESCRSPPCVHHCFCITAVECLPPGHMASQGGTLVQGVFFF